MWHRRQKKGKIIEKKLKTKDIAQKEKKV